MADSEREREPGAVEKEIYGRIGDAIGAASGDGTGLLGKLWGRAIEEVAANPKRFNRNVATYGTLPGSGQMMLVVKAMDDMEERRRNDERQQEQTPKKNKKKK
ncbi:hypothetical protein ABT116_08625 [Streptomyces sp. NPDC002130]|uniref:hypothetical protein n=1 Tax=Streptomyces sp. NPDC002130 TaxID=3155568 RepID=UPI00332FD31D